MEKASTEVIGLAFLDFMVRMRGLEPPRCHHHRLLRPARLPVPPHPHAGKSLCERLKRVSRMAPGVTCKSNCQFAIAEWHSTRPQTNSSCYGTQIMTPPRDGPRVRSAEL